MVGGVEIEPEVVVEMGAAAASVEVAAIAMEWLTTMKVIANPGVCHRAAALDPESLADCVHIRPVYPVIC